MVVDKNGNTRDIPLASRPMNGTIVTPGSKLVKQKEEHGEQQNNPNRLRDLLNKSKADKEKNQRNAKDVRHKMRGKETGAKAALLSLLQERG